MRRGRRARHAATVVAAGLVLAACTSAPAAGPPPSATASPTGPSSATPTGTPSGPPGTPSPSPTTSHSPRPAGAQAVVRPVPQAQWDRMVAVGMVRDGCPVRTPAELRRVEVNHYRFDGTVGRGVLVVRDDVADSVARIFTRLYAARFPIRQMRPLEEFGGDNTASLAADNTAAFNCRRPNQINAPPAASPHANGRAIDVNPLENPWVDLRCRCWKPSARYAERTPGPGKILEGGLVYRTFVDEGWVWQDIATPDYMHFDTGYPSRPRQLG